MNINFKKLQWFQTLHDQLIQKAEIFCNTRDLEYTYIVFSAIDQFEVDFEIVIVDDYDDVCRTYKVSIARELFELDLDAFRVESIKLFEQEIVEKQRQRLAREAEIKAAMQRQVEENERAEYARLKVKFGDA